MRLTLQLLTGTKYYLHVNPQDKVRKVKVDIFKELEIKSKVRLMWQNQPMEDCITLRALGITDDTTVQMIVEPDTQLKLTIETLKKGTVSVMLNDSSTVKDLIKKLSTSTLMLTSMNANDFYFNQVQLSDEDLPFHFYGITDGSSITQKYEGSFKIQLVDGRRHLFLKYITLRASDTIKDLREKVLETINRRSFRMVCEDDIILFQSQNVMGNAIYNELDRDTFTVAQSNIQPRHTIVCIRYDFTGDKRYIATINVFNNTAWHKKRVFGVFHMESVQSMKLKIQHQLHIPHEKQVLFVGQVHANNELPLRDKISKDNIDQIYVIVQGQQGC